MYALILAAMMNAPMDLHHVMHAAASKYYNLRANHIIGFRADMHPTFPYDSSIDAAKMKRFTDATFIVTDRNDNVALNYLPASATDDLRQFSGFDGIFRNLQQQVTSSFGIWSLFCDVSPWPQTGTPYDLTRDHYDYILYYAVTGGSMTIKMNHELLITEIDTSSNGTASVIKPSFKQTAKGLVPIAYDWNYTTNGVKTHVSTSITYTDVNGDPFPSHFETKSRSGTTSTTGSFDLDHVGLASQ
jgi:hypothetical protein